MRKHYTGKERAELVDLVGGGLTTVAEAARQLGVTRSTAYSWMRGTANAGAGRSSARAGGTEAPLAKPTFVQLVRSGEASSVLVVRIGGAQIQVRGGFDAKLLRAVVEALGGTP
jgi:transposase-like protein